MNKNPNRHRSAPHASAKSGLPVIAAVFIAMALMTLITACGYVLVGTGPLPAGIKRVQVPLFENKTTRFELDLKLTRAVINEFVSRGSVEITTDAAKADAVLKGLITNYIVNPIAFSNQKTADRYDILVVADITLTDVRTGKIIYANPSYQYKTEYQVPQGADFESSESEALDVMAKLFARGLIVAILEGF
ncbi:MAG: LptE family protein [Candidatus Aminicenantes bacterium]|nr:LptE family protein [Candidatus Aminicenantes bacterium]